MKYNRVRNLCGLVLVIAGLSTFGVACNQAKQEEPAVNPQEEPAQAKAAVDVPAAKPEAPASDAAEAKKPELGSGTKPGESAPAKSEPAATEAEAAPAKAETAEAKAEKEPAKAEVPSAKVEPGAELGLKDLEGDWLGVLDAKRARLRIAMHVRVKDGGKVEATFDSLDQGAMGLPISSLTAEKGEFRAQSDLVHAVFAGKIVSRDKLDGIWKQGTSELAFQMDRTAQAAVLNRPQEPKPPYPYSAIEVVIERPEANVTLVGTLTLPKATGPVPAVLLISGSGLQDRNEALFGHKPFLVLADHLTRAGIAVLRVDDRGMGASKGDVMKATSQDFAEDAKAEFEYLRKVPQVDPKRVGLIGHSEGGLIAAMLAASNPDMAFIVLLAGPGIPGEQIVLRQVEANAAVEGLPAEEVKRLMGVQKEVFRMLATLPEERLRKDLKEYLMRETVNRDRKDGKAPESAEAKIQVEKALDQQIEGALSPWFRFFMSHDPGKDLEKVSCPVLALNGEKDTQVDPEVNLKAIAAALERAGNKNVRTEKLAGLNHVFQTASTGLVQEYATIEETFQPAALALVSKWILDTLASHPAPVSKD